MVGSKTKREQARHERTLQDLIRTVPGNDRCADCGARNPGWASYSLGVFLCMRCASLHRKLGTHISKVKSLSMDYWSAEEVEHMRTHGNTLVNRIYNPRNIKASIPLDVDEVDSAIEKYIRQKYQERSLADGKPKPLPKNDDEVFRSSRSSNESPPPPLPPKKGRLFGFSLRATSSAYPLSKHDKKSLPIEPTMENAFHIHASQLPANKPSQVFGTSIGEVDSELEAKLRTLKEMGFPDERRNATVLRGLNGNLEKTVESLCRLGEGSRPNSQNPTPVGSSRNTPITAQFPDAVKSPISKLPTAKSTNPFDPPEKGGSFGLSFVQPPTQSSNSLPVSPTQSNNPFGIPPGTTDPIQPLEQSFQGLQVSRQLFPHSTGGYPSQPPPFQQPIFQQSLTPPVPVNNYNPFFQPHQSQQTLLPPTSDPFFNNVQTSVPTGPTNPFLHQTPFSPQPMHQPMQAPYGSTDQPSAPLHNQAFPSVQSQPDRNTFNQPPSLSQLPPSSAYPFPPYGQDAPQQQQLAQHSQQPLLPQATGRMDKGSILALYNYPQLAPAKLPTIQDIPTPTGDSGQIASPQTDNTTSLPEGYASAKRSVTMPAAMSRNPFLPANPASSGLLPHSGAPGILARHSSRESTDLAGLQSGRHSPDAFASLSSRFA